MTANTALIQEYTADRIPYGVRSLLTERAGPMAVEPVKLANAATRGKGFIQELADGRFRVRAKAQHCGVKNRNNRVYPAPVWEQHLVPGTPFQAKLAGRGAIGHLEHPGDGKSQMPLGAIVVTEASPPDENGEVWITFETMSTPPGRVVEAYIRDRVRFGLSSRGNGSVQNRAGVDEVQMDFDPITWDCVIDESTPGAEVPADSGLRESIRKAWDELNGYVRALHERAKGDAAQVLVLAEADARKAASAIDCKGNVCKCPITESAVPPSGFSRYLLAFEDGSAHYRAYQGTTGQWEVWMHPHNLSPERLASKVPTLDACQMVAENHYKLVLGSGAMSAQQHAARSNAIGADAVRLPPTNVQPIISPVIDGMGGVPNIGGMAGMMGRYSAPAGPAMQSARTPKIVLSFESIRPRWQKVLAKLQETWKDVMPLPYSGTVMRIRTKPGASALPVLKRAGMVASLSRGMVEACSPFESGTVAAAHARRVLAESGIKARVEAVGTIRHGRIVVEGDIMGISRQAMREQKAGNDGSQSGEMAGGDTVPEPTGKKPGGISPHYKGEDPEDLNHNLDINEEMEGGGVETDDTDEESYGEGPSLEAGADMSEDDDASDVGPDIDYDDDGDVDVMGDTDMDDADDMGMGGDTDDDADILMDEEPEVPPSMPEMPPPNESRRRAAPNRAARFERNMQRPSRMDIFRENYARFARAGSKPGKKETTMERAYYLTFTRRLNERGSPVQGAVRIWFNRRDKPVSYEFYDRQGILEAVTDKRLRITHSALAEGKRPRVNLRREVWVGENRRAYPARQVVRMGLREEDLPGRHGGETGVVVKGDEYMGKEGPEYSTISGMNDPGERGEEGDGLAPGDYDNATSAGDGKVVKTGTWPTSGSPVSMPSESRRRVAEGDDDKDDEDDKKKDERARGRISDRSAAVNEADDEKKDDEDDKKDESFDAGYVNHLREKLAFLEAEVTRYEGIVQEQHETIEALRESATQAEMERARAEAIAEHPELRRVESRLMRCESVEALNEEVASLLMLVEKKNAPATPSLVERRNGNGAHSGAPRDGVPPSESLTESSSPHSDGLRAGARLGNGDVASRVAAHRKRRRI